MSALSVDRARLSAFLARAVRATFVLDGPYEKTRGIKVRHFIEGEFFFEDRYVGNIVDTGISLIWLDRTPIWAMSYRGGVRLGFESLSSRVFTFLREALLLPDMMVPVRGPKEFWRDEWAYSNVLSGEITEFTGSERITWNGQDVYWRTYCGGLVKDDRAPISLV